MAELADALASGASDRKIIGVQLPSPAHNILFMADCVFCKIIEKEIPAHIIWENGQFLAFLDVNPVNPGHLLIIPKEHIESVFDLPGEQYDNIFKTAKALSTPLQNAMGSKRVGMVVEGFGMPHAHLHLVPINHGHDLDSIHARPMPNDELSATAEKIKKEVEKTIK